MPAVSQVIRGSLTITDASGTTPTATIASVDTSRSIVMATWRGGAASGSARDLRETFKVYLSSSTQITFERNSASFAPSIVVEYTVVEFDVGAVTVQAGSTAPTADPTDIAITAVNTAAAFPVLYHTTDLIQAVPLPLPTFVQTTNPGDTLRLDFASTPGTADYSARWQILEFDSADASVQTGAISFANDTPGTATITSVDQTKTLVAGFVNGGNSTDRRAEARIDLNSATQVGAQMQNLGTSLAANARYYVIEMLDGSTVEAGRTQIASGSTSPGTAPSWATAMTDGAVFANRGNPNAYISNAVNGGSIDTNVSVAIDTPQDSLTLTRAASAVTIETAWQVVEWAAAGGGTTDAVGSASGTGAASGVGASTAASVGSASGTGTASGVGGATAAAVGSASGSATVSGVGVASTGSTGTAAGTSTVSGVGASVAASVGSAEGSATVSGVGSSASAGSAVGTASGTATVSGVGASVAAAVGTASGSSNVVGIGPAAAQESPSGGFSYDYLDTSRHVRQRASSAVRQLSRLPKREAKNKARAVYRIVLDTAPEELAPIIAPFVSRLTNELLPPADAVQFDRLIQDAQALRSLYVAYFEAMENEELEILLLAS